MNIEREGRVRNLGSRKEWIRENFFSNNKRERRIGIGKDWIGKEKRKNLKKKTTKPNPLCWCTLLRLLLPLALFALLFVVWFTLVLFRIPVLQYCHYLMCSALLSCCLRWIAACKITKNLATVKEQLKILDYDIYYIIKTSWWDLKKKVANV